MNSDGENYTSSVDTNVEGDENEGVLLDNDVVYSINTFGADFDVEGLVKRFDRGDIYRPEFQRSFVWTLPQASRFIESILLGLPIPSVFLYREDESRKLLIVDGLQRLTTLHSYSKGRFPNNDRVFKLKDVRERFDGKTIDELDEEDRRRFDDAIIHAMIIQQISPIDNNDSVFHIFERLNTNGTPLQPQEMRAAIYHGSFMEMLYKLNKNEDWREVFGKPHKRGKDQELILRFLALRFNRSNYERPMKGFLNNFTKSHRTISDEQKQKFSKVFNNTIKRAYSALGKQAFRPIRSMNVAFFDAMMIAISENRKASKEAILSTHEKLKKHTEFMSLTSEATSNEVTVSRRIEIAKDIIDAAAKDN